MFAVHEAVGIEIFLDVQCLCSFPVTSDYIIKAVAVSPHDLKDPLLLCVRGCPVHLEQAFFNCFKDTLVLVLPRCLCNVISILGLEFLPLLDLLDNFL